VRRGGFFMVWRWLSRLPRRALHPGSFLCLRLPWCLTEDGEFLVVLLLGGGSRSSWSFLRWLIDSSGRRPSDSTAVGLPLQSATAPAQCASAASPQVVRPRR
jgi:hypothetical protein